MGGQNRAPQHSFRYERIIFVSRIPSMEDMLILGSKQCFLKSCNIDSPFTYLTMVWSAATKPSGARGTSLWSGLECIGVGHPPVSRRFVKVNSTLNMGRHFHLLLTLPATRATKWPPY